MKPSYFARPLILAVSLCTALSAEARELSLIRGDFENSGVVSDAKGVARASFTPKNPKFRLDLSGLTPAASYQFSVDGILEETIVADRRGGIHKDFRLTPSASKLALDFDPRGAVLSINDGTDELLSMIFSGEGEPDKMRVDERTDLARAESELRGRVSLRYLEQTNQDRFIVHFLGMERGDYEFFVDGKLLDEISLNKGRSTQRTFRLWKGTHAKKNPQIGHGKDKNKALDFDPRGLVVDVVRGGEIIFSGEMLAQIEGINGVQTGEASLDLTSTGLDVDATGSTLLSLDEEGVLSLTIEVGNLPAGDYEVLVGGTIRGTLSVTGADPGSTGTLVFASEPEADEVLLDFDVFGKTVDVRQGANSFFTATLPLTLTELAPPTTVHTELPLLNQGVIATASSHIELTTEADTLVELEIDLSGVPAGNYDFKVGGVVKGTIVVADVDGVISGELRFANDGIALPLNFDPSEQTVTIEQAADILLSRPL